MVDLQSLRRKKLHRTSKSSNFSGGSFSNRDNIRALIQFRKEGEPQHLKRSFFIINRPIHFHINRTIIRPIKRNQLSLPRIKVKKSLLTPVPRIFKFTSQFKLLPQIRCLITLRIVSSIISIDSNITDNIIRKVINV